METTYLSERKRMPEQNEDLVKAIINKVVSLIEPPFIVVDEGNETYYLFRCRCSK